MVKKTNFLLFSLIAALIASPAYSVTVTKTYVDKQDTALQSNILLLRDMLNNKDSSGNWVTLETDAQLAIPAINELKAALDAKANADDVLTSDSLTELNDAIDALKSGKATVEDLATLQSAVDSLGEIYATDDELAAQIDAVKNLIPSVTDYVLASDLAAVATSGSYNDLIDRPTIPSVEGLVTSQQLADLQETLQTAIAEKHEKGEYLVASDLTTLNDAITALQTGKADASTVTTIQETINKLGETYATKADMTTADEALQSAIDNMDLSAYAKIVDMESGLALKENVANKVDVATAEQIEAMSSDEKATKYPSISVTQTIANAAVTKVNEVAGDLSSLQTQVDTNVADIKKIKEAGYQTSEDVQGAITTATADLATKSEVYTKTEVDTAIGAIKEYDDTELAGRVTANETNIAANTSAIENINNAGYIAQGDARAAGKYLMQVDENGAVSWLDVQIVDAPSEL